MAPDKYQRSAMIRKSSENALLRVAKLGFGANTSTIAGILDPRDGQWKFSFHFPEGSMIPDFNQKVSFTHFIL
jgi:hypothetical protein